MQLPVESKVQTELYIHALVGIIGDESIRTLNTPFIEFDSQAQQSQTRPTSGINLAKSAEHHLGAQKVEEYGSLSYTISIKCLCINCVNQVKKFA